MIVDTFYLHVMKLLLLTRKISLIMHCLTATGTVRPWMMQNGKYIFYHSYITSSLISPLLLTLSIFAWWFGSHRSKTLFSGENFEVAAKPLDKEIC